MMFPLIGQGLWEPTPFYAPNTEQAVGEMRSSVFRGASPLWSVAAEHLELPEMPGYSAAGWWDS